MDPLEGLQGLCRTSFGLGQVKADSRKAESIFLRVESGHLGLGWAGSGLPEAGSDLQEAGSGLPETDSDLQEVGSDLPETDSDLQAGSGLP